MTAHGTTGIPGAEMSRVGRRSRVRSGAAPMKAWLYLQRLVPLVGLGFNRFRFPGLHTGLHVEIRTEGRVRYGRGVRIGEATRIDLLPDSDLAVGDAVMIGRGAYLVLPIGARLGIGEATSLQDGCRIYGDVAIGRGCIFAPNVFVSSGAHTFEAIPYRTIRDQERAAPAPSRPVRILDDCWIGVNAVVQPGVTIARGCVVGANSVVTHDLPPYAVAAGSPARVIRTRLDFAPKARIDAGNEGDLPYFYDGFDLPSPAVRDARVARQGFTLALARAGARAVRLSVSGAGGTITFRERREATAAQPRAVEFVLAEGEALPFLRFGTDGVCNVHWAELI
jgi:acetyltransferase-like isoleucine patch superfamily enzyme